MLEKTALRALAELEAVVDKGIATFIEVGQALLEIRDRKLYLELGDKDFTTYLERRWPMHPRHAYRLIDAAKVAEIVCPTGQVLPERQLRELAPLKNQPEKLRKVYKQAAKLGPAQRTASAVKDLVQRAIPARFASKQTVDHPIPTSSKPDNRPSRALPSTAAAEAEVVGRLGLTVLAVRNLTDPSLPHVDREAGMLFQRFRKDMAGLGRAADRLNRLVAAYSELELAEEAP